MKSIVAPGHDTFFQIHISHPYITSGFSFWEMRRQLAFVFI